MGLPEALFAALVGVLLPLRAWRRGRRRAPPAPTPVYLCETALLIAALSILLWRNGVTLAALGLQPRASLRFAADLLVCLGVIVGLDAWAVWRLMRRLRAQAIAPPPASAFADDIAAGGRAPRAFAAVAIVGAIWEELCFRATVFLLAPPTPAGLALAIVSGSLLFGAQHLRNGRGGFIYSAGYGLLFSLLFLATHNLIAVIAAHAAGNILTVLQWAPRIERARRRAQPAPPTAPPTAPPSAPIFLG